MRRKGTILLYIVLAVMMLTGCHGRKAGEDFVMPDSFDESKHNEITFWAKNDTNKSQTQIYQDAINGFEKLYPNVHVNIRLYTDYGKIYNDVITNISTGTTPNVCITYPDHIATYITGNNTVVPLDEIFDDPEYGLGGSEVKFDSPSKDEIVPKFLEECKIGDSYYAVPYMRSSEACYINKTYVEKLGYEVPDVLTWDFVYEVSKAALEKDDDGNFIINGQKVMIPFIYKSTDNMMIQMIKQAGGEYSDDNGNILLFNDKTKELLFTISDIVKDGGFSTFKISGYPANFLNAGQCIFAIDSTAGATWMGSDAPLADIDEDAFVEFETAVRPVPQFDTQDPKMISQGPSICIFNKPDSQEVLASWLFAEYLLTNEIQTAYAMTEGYIPVTTKAQETSVYIDYLSKEGMDNKMYYSVKIQASKLILDNVNNTFVTPVFNGSASLRDAAGALVENVTKSTRRGETIDQAYMDKLYSDIISLYRLDSLGETSVRQEFGKMPVASKLLIAGLCLVWGALISGFTHVMMKRSRDEK